MDSDIVAETSPRISLQHEVTTIKESGAFCPPASSEWGMDSPDCRMRKTKPHLFGNTYSIGKLGFRIPVQSFVNCPCSLRRISENSLSFYKKPLPCITAEQRGKNTKICVSQKKWSSIRQNFPIGSWTAHCTALTDKPHLFGKSYSTGKLDSGYPYNRS